MLPEISRVPPPVLPPELPQEVSPKRQGVTRRGFIVAALQFAACIAAMPLIKVTKTEQPTPPPPDLEVPESEISTEWRDALGVTINVANWFRFPEKSNLVDDAEHLQNYINDVDIKQMVDLGITSVRLPVSMNWISRDSEKSERLESVSAAIRKFEKAGIHTIISMHDLNQQLIEDQSYADTYIKDWGALVSKLVQHHSHTTLALDPINEPVFENRNRWMWNNIQRRLLAETRRHTKSHIFIAKPAAWATREGLNDLALLNDPLVIYDVHFYEPYILTHQNANEGSSEQWANPMTDGITHLDFPVPEDQNANIKWRNKWEQEYYEKGWNPDKVKQCVQEIADWGKKKKVPLWISEVGAWSKHMKEGTRELWMSTVAEAILESKEILGIGIWSWDEMFGFNAKNNNVELDQTAVKVVREHVEAIAALSTQAGRIYTGEPR